MAITASSSAVKRVEPDNTKYLPADAVDILYGALVVQDLGFVKEVTGTAQGHLKVIGVARGSAPKGLRKVTLNDVDNSAGSAGDLNVAVEFGLLTLKNDSTSPLTAAHVGSPCYAKDNEIASADSDKGNRPLLGIFLGLEDDGRALVDVGSDGRVYSGEVVEVLANADLSSTGQFRFVEIVNSSGAAKAALAAADTDIVSGVLLNKPAIGAPAFIAVSGFAPLVAGSAGWTAGQAIEATTSGAGVTASTTDFFGAIGLETATDTQVKMVLIQTGILAA